MVGRTLTEIRARLRELSVPDGRYLVRCGRTGDRPVPVDELRFPDREAAVEAVGAAHAYRATLRRYDPRAPWYDFVVCQAGEASESAGGRDWAFPPPAADASDRALVAYCHDLAGAVFEALSTGAHDGVERTVMDAYLAAAEETADRDRLCLSLLATMAVELRDLPPSTTRDVLSRATTYLPPAPTSATPVTDGLAHLRTRGVLDEFRVVDPGPRTVVVSGYELPRTGDRLPTLPVTVEAFRRAAGSAPTVEGATRRAPGVWALTVGAGATDALASVPVGAER